MLWPALRSSRLVRAGHAELISVGTFCHAAAALREAGLRRWAGPFDWLLSSPDMVTACIEDDFAELLNTSSMHSVAPSELPPGAKRQCRHLVLEERFGLPTLFNHHDPLSDRGDFQKLTRSIDRFRRALLAAHNKTFVVLAPYEVADDAAERLAVSLRTRSPTNRLAVISMEVGGERAWTQAPRGEDFMRVRLAVTSPSTGVQYENPDDEKLLQSSLKALSARGCRS